jgi:hydroxyacylglutathione hydrolase
MPFIKIFCFNDFAENTMVLVDGQACVIIDPGCYKKEESDELIQFIEGQKLQPERIINTHCHIDHILGVERIKTYFHIPFVMRETDMPTLKSARLSASLYGYHGFVEPEPDDFIDSGYILKLGEQAWETLDVPGHSPGHIALYNREAAVCISGDVLFKRSIGRTDLPGGDHEILIRSIRTKLFTLPDHTKIYPGHGPQTSIGDEKKFNPFCSENAP